MNKYRDEILEWIMDFKTIEKQIQKKKLFFKNIEDLEDFKNDVIIIFCEHKGLPEVLEMWKIDNERTKGKITLFLSSIIFYKFWNIYNHNRRHTITPVGDDTFFENWETYYKNNLNTEVHIRISKKYENEHIIITVKEEDKDENFTY